MLLKGKVVLISGGAGGIGSSVANELIQKGAEVYSMDKNKTNKPIKGVYYLLADLTNSQEIEQAIDTISKKVDIFISAAGVMRRGTIFDSSEEDYDYLMDNNVKSAWLLLKCLKPKFSDKPTIVQISSGHALKPETDPGLYTLSKKATSSIAEILALTCPQYEVKTVYPGPILTNLLLTERTKEDKARISKIAHKPAAISKLIIQLIESDKHALIFDPKIWDYVLG